MCMCVCVCVYVCVCMCVSLSLCVWCLMANESLGIKLNIMKAGRAHNYTDCRGIIYQYVNLGMIHDDTSGYSTEGHSC